MKLRVRYGVAIIKRADEWVFDSLMRIKRVDECLRGRQQNEDQENQECGEKEKDLAAASHSDGDEIPTPKLQIPKKSQTTNFNGRGSTSVWRLGVGACLGFGIWGLGFLTVPFLPGSFSPSSSIPRRVAVPVCPSEFFRTFRKTRRLAPAGIRCRGAGQ